MPGSFVAITENPLLWSLIEESLICHRYKDRLLGLLLGLVLLQQNKMFSIQYHRIIKSYIILRKVHVIHDTRHEARVMHNEGHISCLLVRFACIFL